MNEDYIEPLESNRDPSLVEVGGTLDNTCKGRHGDKSEGSNREEGTTQTLLSEADLMQLEFDTDEAALEWYKMYAKCMGFGVRKDDSGHTNKGELLWRQFVCNREGKRAEKHLNSVDRVREPRVDTRTNCKACFRVKVDKASKKWKVVKACVEHNHNLAPPEHAHLIPSHRTLNEADVAQVESMRAVGVKTTHIMGFICGQSGGPAGVGFTRKDLYNHLDKQRRSLIADGDAFAALSYLQAKAENDPMMFVKFTTDAEGRLQNLFWCDGISRLDYEVFGDVLAFDATYRKNKYNKPLVIFSGLNHHHQTVVFACALLLDETIDTYKWVLESLLEAMGQKKPDTVVTDGDNAMRKAIKELFPRTTHRLCTWHLHRNAKTNVKHEGFSDDFQMFLYGNLSTEEWEKEWEKLVANYNVHEHPWVTKMYKRRAMWGNPFLKGKFFAGIRTTSMCEGINSFIKNYVEAKHSLMEFLHHFHRAIANYRNNELNEDFASSYGEQVMTSPLHGIESSAAKLYTKELFKRFKRQLNEVAALIATPSDIMHTTIIYDVSAYCEPHMQWRVHCDRNAKLLKCSCSYFESCGIPCSHIICILKHEHIDSLPPSLVCNRWTKNCKSINMSQFVSASDSGERLLRLRYAALVSSSNRMCYLGSQTAESFKRAREVICDLTDQFERQRQLGLINSQPKQGSADVVVGDPATVQSKGAPKKKGKRNRCSKCKSTGHNRRRCPLIVSNGQDDGRTSSEDSEDADKGPPITNEHQTGVHSMELDYRLVKVETKVEHHPFPTQQLDGCLSNNSEWFNC